MFPLTGAVPGDGDVPGDAPRARGPYPLAVFTAGFLVDAEQYASYARRLCSWGYVVVQYNKRENVAGNALDDVVSAAMIRDLIGWAQSDVLLGQLVDTAGDERGAGCTSSATRAAAKSPRWRRWRIRACARRASWTRWTTPSTRRWARGSRPRSRRCASAAALRIRRRCWWWAASAEATARRRGPTTLTSRAAAARQLGRGARGRRALPVPGQRHVRAEGGVRGGPRLRRGGAGREPGAHGGARRDCLPRRAAPRRATRHAAEAGGRARLGRARGTGFENAGGSLDGVAGFDVMIWVYFAPERYRTLKISDTKAHARRAHASVSLRSSSDQSSGSPSESGSSGSSSESSARTPVL